MKTFFSFIAILICTLVFAQDKTYVHVASVINTSFNGTIIDHPDLNNNPNAKIVFSHLYQNSTGIINNNVNGLWYRASDGRWIIYNEDFNVDMVIGTTFTIFIADDAEVFTHIASTANQGTSNSNTLLDHPLLNGEDPGPVAIYSNYFNPNQVYNNNNCGFTFDTTLFNNRLIYNESFSPIPTNAAFKVMVIPSGGLPGITTFGHLTSDANSSGSSTILDNPALNDNPDAAFVFSHYFGVFGAPSNNNIDKAVGAVYESTDGRWRLFTEDFSNMPIGVAFDIVIAAQETLSVTNNELETNFALYPNPAKDNITISVVNTQMESITIFSILGNEISKYTPNTSEKTIDVSALSAGTYLIKIETENATKTMKFIKQ